jgi:hypothetical protein
MNSAHLHPSRPSTPYYCSSCSRCFIAYRNSAADNLVCACGAVLAPGSLPRGVYELRSAVPDDSRVTNPALPSSSAGISTEADLGYGKSHGYGPAHGGPTGPGDAPAAGDAEGAQHVERDEPGAAGPRAGN